MDRTRIQVNMGKKGRQEFQMELKENDWKWKSKSGLPRLSWMVNGGTESTALIFFFFFVNAAWSILFSRFCFPPTLHLLSFISNSMWLLTWILYAKIWLKDRTQESHLPSRSFGSKSYFFLSCADVSPTDHSTPFQERPASSPFKYAMINAGAAYLDAPVTFLSMWVCMSGGAHIYECLWVSVFKLFMRLKCSSGMPCNTLWK